MTLYELMIEIVGTPPYADGICPVLLWICTMIILFVVPLYAVFYVMLMIRAWFKY